MNSDDNVRKCR